MVEGTLCDASGRLHSGGVSTVVLTSLYWCQVLKFEQQLKGDALVSSFEMGVTA